MIKIVFIITRFFSFSFYIILLTTCTAKSQVDNKGAIVYGRTHFYDSLGKPTFTDTLKIWYKDSMAIEEIHRIVKATDTANVTTTSYKILGYRLTDLRSNRWYAYKNFSDTAEIFRQHTLPPDSVFWPGWRFYSHTTTIQIQGVPELLGDTIIDKVLYKRIKFNSKKQDPKKEFEVGYLRCDGKDIMFSLEKSYSSVQNCVMTKVFSFQYGKRNPYGSLEIDFISDTLPEKILHVFNAWERNAKSLHK